ncbi:MAG: SDR family oxidoreductase [Elusimicrobiota bacterium]
MKRALEGKTALITGASGGIGSAVARLFADNGCRIALHYSKNRRGAEALAKTLRAQGAGCELFQADLLQGGACERLIRATLKRFGRLDILVNNAGAVLGQRYFLDLPAKDWDRTLRLNLTAPFLLAREAFKAMRRKGGRIINISSIAAKFGGSPRSMHYGAAKAALEAVTVAMAKEGAPRGILVNTVRAGVIDTPFHSKFRKDMSKRVALIPLGRMGRPEEVARMALHLAGEGGDFITGQTLPVTGGE